MKPTLQLQEIAGYFANGLRIKILNYKCDYVGIEYAEVNGHYFLGESLHLTYVGGSTGKDCNNSKPILRPMSDLFKSEWASFVDEWNLSYLMPTGWGTDFQLGDPVLHWGLRGNSNLFYELYKNHFDIHNLIGRGLAISIHDIPTK